MGEHGEEEERLGFTYTYDVFISFRGEDTRNTFIGHLRRELGRMGIKSFNDDRNMRIGESLSPALSKAIEESKIFIVVFSENYASSTWCLDELVKIIKRSKMKKKMHLVYPVFYHVDPSDIEHERNSFGKHMKAHENEIGKESERMQDWRSAFSQAAVDFQGRHISTGDDESYCIKEIVAKVHEYITPKSLYSGQNPVGLDACIEEVMSLLEMKPYDKTVNMLGIYGLSGIGKTELAIALYNKIVQHFDAASFLSDVREKSNRINGIKDLQKTLLSEMFEELETELGSTSKEMTEIEEKLQKKKVLLVLDDVGDKDQLENLAGGGKWFGPGSRIIITTREKDVLISHQVKNMYEMNELDDQHSLELFCWNAFRQSYPKTGFEDVSVRAVDYAKGLPLALKRIGSDLATFHESLEDWEMAMEEYERTPNKKIQDVLKISYDKLDDKAKQISLFISFRGEDTRYTFIGHLRRELGRRGIKSFNDDRNMRIGESLSPALSKAIEESKIFIVVFSENYASSTRCLDELVRIIERSKMKEKKQLVYPVFYHVDPSDIRHERNSFGKHMKAHEHEIGKESQRMQAWRSALSQAVDFPERHIITTGDDESYCIEEIVEKVHEYIIPKPLYSGQNPVGLEACIEEVMSLLDMKPDDKTVRMLGIYGLGGIGKTELAKALYNKIVQHFDAASFLSDVREKSNRINGMEDLQKTLFSEMFEELETKLESTIKGMGEIKEKLQKKKVLLVLDDVGDKDQLEKLAGECNWFGPGSRIIITTREENVLIAHQVKLKYEMKELDDQHSLELFCWNAFKQSYPKTGFEDVSVRAVDYAKGLPLALKVIGSDLAAFHESLEDWEMAMKEYEKTPNTEIQDVLKISYDRLDDNAKQIFLDIACFFKGERMEYVKKILLEFCPTTNMKVLLNKSLITVEYDCLKMHDLIQDMGREIVKKESINPAKRSRIWYYEDAIEILTKDYGSDKIQGIMLDPPQREEVEWSGTALVKMECLRILIVRNTSFSSELEHLPNYLRLLDWEECPSKSFPPKFNPENIIVLNLPRSRLTLEEPFKKFPCLTIMDFSYNQSIKKIPDMSELQILRELRLDHCRELTAVHESVGELKRLAHLSVSGCIKLKKFVSEMFLPSLEVFDLNLCESLGHFPEIRLEMTKPLKIYMINTAIQELPESIGKLTGLECIDISNNRELKCLPSSLFMLPNVVSLKIEACSKLQESFRSLVQHPSKADVRPKLQSLNVENDNLSDEDLLAILCYFPNLKELIASENNFVSIPSCIKECGDLTSLELNGCEKLKKIPEFTNLRILDVHHCSNLEEISELSSTVQKVDARFCFKLTRETSDMLWNQVKKKGVRGIELVMPFTTEIPEWFNYVGVQRYPRFWVRKKFPNIALAMIFHFQDESEREKFARRRVVDLRLLINGQYVPCKRSRKFRIEAEHILIFDLRVLFSDKEWLGLDRLLMKKEWNLVQIAYKATFSFVISRWGAFVYEEETKMDDLVFASPNPMDPDEIPQAIVPKKDDMEEYKMMIESLGLDESYKRTLNEWLDNKGRGGFEGMAENHSMQIVLGELQRISQDAENALKAVGSALKDPKSTLRQILDALKNDDGKPKVTIIGDLALIRLEHPVKLHNVGKASTSGHTGSEEEEEEEGYDPQLEEIVRQMFDDGMTDGLLEAQNRFPSLDILETISAALEKGYRVRWRPEDEVQTSIETRTYISGIYSGLLEAKLRFPDLDIWPTINTVAKRKGITETFGSPNEAKSSFPHLDWTPHDPLMQIFMMMKQQSPLEPEVKSKLFWKLKEEHQALRDKFAQLENGNENAAQNTASSRKNQYDKFVGKSQEKLDHMAKYEKVSVVLKGRGEELGKLYDGGVEGFQESEEFEDVMSAIYLNGLRGGVLEARAILLTLHTDIETEEGVTDDPVIVKEAPTSGHKESEEEEAITWELWYEGIRDGVLEAQNRFPSLDIDDTISIALGKGSGIEWTSKGMEIIPSAENRTYLSGVYGGVLEAKLRFPDLDVWETLNTVANRRGINTAFVSPPEPKQRIPQLDWTTVTLPPSHDPLMKIFMMMNQQGTSESEVKSKLFSQMKEENQVLGRRFAQLEKENENENENAAQNTPSSSKNPYDELIQKFNIQYDEFVGKGQDKLDHVAEYEQVSGVLKGRGEELERLFNGLVKRLQKSEEFEDLMSVIYLNGLRDGVLEALVILLALRTDTN